MFSIIICLSVLIRHSEAGVTLEADVVVRRVKCIVCRTDVNLSSFPGQTEMYHQWNQVYTEAINYSVSNIPPIKAINTMFSITLEKFDNNTKIYNSFTGFNAGFHQVLSLSVGCSGSEIKKIKLYNDEYYEYHIDSIVTYRDSLKFSCQQYSQKSNKYIQIGWINTRGNRIITYNQSEITMKMTEVHNGSMLCCLYYIIYTEKNAKRIQRFVENKTLLIHHKKWTNTGRQDSGSGVDTISDAGVIIISSISAIGLVVLVGTIAIIKKRCWTNPNQPERPQLPINGPFYLNLLFRRECEQEIAEAEEQNYYEEID